MSSSLVDSIEKRAGKRRAMRTGKLLVYDQLMILLHVQVRLSGMERGGDMPLDLVVVIDDDVLRDYFFMR